MFSARTSTKMKLHRRLAFENSRVRLGLILITCALFLVVAMKVRTGLFRTGAELPVLTSARQVLELRLVGIGVVQVDENRAPQSFRVMLGGPDSIVVLAEPSWWTRDRVVRAFGLLTAAILGAVI